MNPRLRNRRNHLSSQTLIATSPIDTRVAFRLPLSTAGVEHAVTQRCIEMVIGRLVTDEEFRETFAKDPHQALAELLERGTHLTHAEIAALVATDPRLWEHVAERVDPRLQKVSLTSE